MSEIKIAIGAIAKCENRNIREWVEYHKNLGIDRIFLYDNNDVDGEKFEDVINDYIESGYVKLIDWKGKKTIIENGHCKVNTQSDMCNHCYKMVSEEYPEFDWLAIIDIDEFITLNNITLKDFLSQDKFKNAECVRLNFKMYGDSGLIKVENENYSVKRFTSWVPFANGKSIYRTKLKHIYDTIDGHGTHASINMDEEGNILSKYIPICTVNRSPKYKTAWINHYHTKTIEEYIYRRVIIKDLSPCFKYWPSKFFTLPDIRYTKEKEDWARIICNKYGIKYE